MVNSKLEGLSEQQAAERLKEYGENVLQASKPRSFLTIVWGTVREPMFLLLIACGSLYLALGDLGEASLISTAVVVVIGITIIQERRTERTLDALRELSSPRALVIRDGMQKRIAGKDVVPGDLVIITEGDRVPADGFVLESKALKIDESLLTGESVPVEKVKWNGTDAFQGAAGGDDSPFVYSGTLVVQGSGVVSIHATGQATVMGKIGASLADTKRPPSRLQLDTRRVVKLVAVLSLTLSIVVAVLWWFREHDALRSLLMGLTFAMSTIPEEFPVVLTIFMALGAWRISRKNVLTRQMNAIETLGSATTLCVDKTGTLTENRMTVAEIFTLQGGCKSLQNALNDDFSSDERDLISVGGYASDPEGSDPMDTAAIQVARQLTASFSVDKALQRTFPLVRPILAVGYVWDDQGRAFIASKGAPESILQLCRQSQTEHEIVMRSVRKMADDGFRVLAVARADASGWEKCESLQDFDYEFLGLLGYFDPLKEGVKESVRQCHEAGIKVVMITGDYQATALAIARDCGIEDQAGSLNGHEVASLTDTELIERLKSVRVLSRMVPEQKLRIVKALQSAGEVVAMTGDGVNDAPALKAANIGIAMGDRGTDVAREAAALVLLDDNFTSIVAAVRLGRRIYDNIQNAMTYIIAIHIPIVGLTLVPLVFGTPAILWPVHLAFLELIIDPTCSIVFEAEPEGSGIMQRKPRALNARLFSRKVIGTSVLEGLIALCSILLVFVWIAIEGENPDHARAVAFSSLIFINAALVFSIRGGSESLRKSILRPNPALLWVGSALFILCGIVLFAPPVARLFHFTPPNLLEVLTSAGIAAIILIAFEPLKRVLGRRSSI